MNEIYVLPTILKLSIKIPRSIFHFHFYFDFNGDNLALIIINLFVCLRVKVYF